MHRALKYMSELLAALVAIAVVASGIVVWNLDQKPLEATYLTPYVEQGLAFLVPGTSAKIENTRIIWDNIERSVALEGQQVSIFDAQGKKISELPSLRLKLSILGLLQGRFVPAELTIIKPKFLLERRVDGSLSFGALQSTEGGQDDANGSIQAILTKLTDDLISESLFRELVMRDAQLIVRDATVGREWAFDVQEVAMRHGLATLEGHAKIVLTQDDQTTRFEAYYVFVPSAHQHKVSVKFDGLNPSRLQLDKALGVLSVADLPLNGLASVQLDNKLQITGLNVSVEGGEGRIVLPKFWDEPRTLKKASLNLSYDGVQKKFQITDTSVDFGGTKVEVKGEGVAPQDAAFDQAFQIEAHVSQLPMDQFTSYWPKVAVPGARDWISSSMTKGIFTRADVTLRGKVKWSDLDNAVLESAEGTVSAKGAHVRYLEGVPAVDGVGAEAKFDLTHMDVALTGGATGGLKLLPSTIVLSDFDQDVQHIDIPVRLAGPVRDVLRIIDSPPLGYAKAVGLKADEVDGRIDGALDIKLPLLKDVYLKDVAITADAKLAEFVARKLVPGIEITQGELALNLDDQGVSIKGPASFNKVPVQLAWQTAFSPLPGKPRAEALVTAALTGEQWKAFGIDPFTKPEGTSLLTLRYVQPKTKQVLLSGEVNFKQASFTVERLNWTKPMGAPATLAFAADLTEGKPVQIKSISLEGGQALRVKGTASLDGATGRLLTLDLKPMVLARTNASLHFSQGVDDKAMLRIAVDGESFDVSGVSGGREPDTPDHRSKDYSLKLNKLYTSETGLISNVTVHAERDKIGWSLIDLRGLADGTSAVEIKLTPQLGDSSRRVFSIKGDDFGKLLKGMGFTDTVHSGAVNITGQSSVDDPRAIEGKAEIGSFDVSGLPVLARLVNAASIIGFVDMMAGRTSFDYLKGTYRWYGDGFELKDTRLAGPAVGVNVDGKVDMNTGETDLRGTLVPFNFVSRMLNVIPVVGSLITGGESEGVLAINYAVKGKLSDPQISVNPASLLTPGFLRDLFFSKGASDTKSGN